MTAVGQYDLGTAAKGSPVTDAKQATLFDRLGGHAGIAAAVADLYDHILDDDELAHFFVGIDVAEVQRHQRELVTTAVGGPSLYEGRTLREAHDGLGIERRHVDLVIRHLAGALARAGVAPADVMAVLSVIDRLWTAQFL